MGSEHSPEDGQNIDVFAPDVVEQWALKFGVTPSKLREAVYAVGPAAREIEAWLLRDRQIG